MKYCLLALLILSLTFSCKKKDQSVNLNYNFFPVNYGHTAVYSVREVTINAQLAQNDTSDYFLKTEIGDTVMDNEGRVARKFNRYTSSSANGPWILKDVWTTIISGGRAELTEENQRVIKLVFPITETQTWNMNAYNTLGTRECYYSGLWVPRSINGVYCDSTVTVEQQDQVNFVDFKRKREVYAAGIGLVQKYYKNYNIINFDTTAIQSGNEIQMSLINYTP